MKEQEREETSLLVREIMRRQYHCESYGSPETVFVARDNERIVGAMALAFSDGEPFHLEEIYDFDPGSFPERFDRTTVVELGRWVASAPFVSEILLYGAIQHAHRLGRRWAIGEIKPSVARRYAQIGLYVVPLDTSLNLSRVPVDVAPYYILPPRPMLCALRIDAASAILQKKVERLKERVAFSVAAG